MLYYSTSPNYCFYTTLQNWKHGKCILGTMSRIKIFLHQAWIACIWIALLRCSTISTKC